MIKYKILLVLSLIFFNSSLLEAKSTVIKNALKGLFNTVIPHWFFII